MCSMQARVRVVQVLARRLNALLPWARVVATSVPDGSAPKIGTGLPEPRTDPPTTLEFDPVCGARVDPSQAIGVRMIAGRKRYLCSRRCLETCDRLLWFTGLGDDWTD